MRLNKYIAGAGACSRRKADELTINGNVRINGVVMKEPGYDVVEGDRVEVNGKLIVFSEKKIYLLLNKPKGYITTTRDEKGRATVMELVNDVPERIFPVGRLDHDTSGLLIMTNDGELAHHLMHPGKEVAKRYRVFAAGTVSGQKLSRLRKGVDIGGYVTSPARVDIIKQSPRSALVEIEIHEGKNRQIRKMFSAVDCPVQALERIAIGEIRLGRLKEGHYRKMTKDEIEYLKKNMKKASEK